MKITDEILALDNDAPSMKNYRVRFTAIIKGSVYVSAKSKDEAAKVFRDDHSFDQVEEFGKYKINNVEEIKR